MKQIKNISVFKKGGVHVPPFYGPAIIDKRNHNPFFGKFFLFRRS